MVSTHQNKTNHDIATNSNLQPFANKNNQAIKVIQIYVIASKAIFQKNTSKSI